MDRHLTRRGRWAPRRPVGRCRFGPGTGQGQHSLAHMAHLCSNKVDIRPIEVFCTCVTTCYDGKPHPASSKVMCTNALQTPYKRLTYALQTPYKRLIIHLKSLCNAFKTPLLICLFRIKSHIKATLNIRNWLYGNSYK